MTCQNVSLCTADKFYVSEEFCLHWRAVTKDAVFFSCYFTFPSKFVLVSLPWKQMWSNSCAEWSFFMVDHFFPVVWLTLLGLGVIKDLLQWPTIVLMVLLMLWRHREYIIPALHAMLCGFWNGNCLQPWRSVSRHDQTYIEILPQLPLVSNADMVYFH